MAANTSIDFDMHIITILTHIRHQGKVLSISITLELAPEHPQVEREVYKTILQ